MVSDFKNCHFQLFSNFFFNILLIIVTGKWLPRLSLILHDIFYLVKCFLYFYTRLVHILFFHNFLWIKILNGNGKLNTLDTYFLSTFRNFRYYGRSFTNTIFGNNLGCKNFVHTHQHIHHGVWTFRSGDSISKT